MACDLLKESSPAHFRFWTCVHSSIPSSSTRVCARTRAPFLTLIVAASCGGQPAVPKPSAPIVESVENTTRVRSCAEAAVGIEQATRAIRPPEGSVVQLMRARCADDRWASDALDCFATMKEGELAKCASTLPEESRHELFAALGGTDEAAVAISALRLADMHVGVTACDELFATARDFMGCEAIPLATRAEIGPQIADSWDLPDKLPADAQARMTTVCTQSREALLQQAVTAGCRTPP